MIQFTLGQFSFGQLENIVACLEIIWFSHRWLFCSSPATSCNCHAAENWMLRPGHNCSYWLFWLVVSKAASALEQ